MFSQRKFPIFLLLIILTALAGLWWLRSVSQANHSRPDDFGNGTLITVNVVEVRLEESFEVEESYAGRVSAHRQSSLGFERTGRIHEISIEEGIRVTPGAVLARLDTQLLEANRDELAATLELNRAQSSEAKARLKSARATVERLSELIRDRNVSQDLFDKSSFEEQALISRLAATEAEIKQTEAALHGVIIKLQKSSIKAPYSGTIVSKHASEGTVIEAGQPVFELVEDEVLDVRVGIPVHVTEVIETGRTYRIEIGGNEFQAILRSILPLISAQTRTATAILRIIDSNERFYIGQLVRLQMTRRVAAKGFWLPISALTESRRGLWGAYVLKPTQYGEKILEVARQEVQMLHSTLNQAYVRGTLASGEKVVAEGVHKIVPGQLVYAN